MVCANFQPHALRIKKAAVKKIIVFYQKKLSPHIGMAFDKDVKVNFQTLSHFEMSAD